MSHRQFPRARKNLVCTPEDRSREDMDDMLASSGDEDDTSWGDFEEEDVAESASTFERHSPQVRPELEAHRRMVLLAARSAWEARRQEAAAEATRPAPRKAQDERDCIFQTV